MKSLLVNAVAVLLFLPAIAGAQPSALKCTADLLQGTKPLTPRTKTAEQFAQFSLELDRDPDEAWEHQNVCVNKRDFQGASFDGTVCIVIVTTKESADADAPTALLVDLSRSPNTGNALQLNPVRKESLGGVTALVPFDRQGKHFEYTQFFARRGGKGELSRLRIECNP